MSIGDTVAKIRALTLICRLCSWVYYIFSFIFRTLEVILRRLDVRLQRYVQKPLFAGFEMVFMAFAFLFLEQWRLFCVDLRYEYKDTGENVIFRL